MLEGGSVWLIKWPEEWSNSRGQELAMPQVSLQLDDSQLVRQTLSGDHKAYEALVRRYQKLVYNMLFQMVSSHETASDLTQETFMKAFRALSTFRQEAKFKPWLLRIASNSCFNLMRDNKNKDYESLEAMLEENPHSEPPGREDVELEVEWKLSHQMLNEALTNLPPRHRQVFMLRYQHDLAYEDIAEVTGEPVTTIKSLLFRIRETLRKNLATKMCDASETVKERR